MPDSKQKRPRPRWVEAHEEDGKALLIRIRKPRKIAGLVLMILAFSPLAVLALEKGLSSSPVDWVNAGGGIAFSLICLLGAVVVVASLLNRTTIRLDGNGLEVVESPLALTRSVSKQAVELESFYVTESLRQRGNRGAHDLRVLSPEGWREAVLKNLPKKLAVYLAESLQKHLENRKTTS